jgi:hypothetical protein
VAVGVPVLVLVRVGVEVSVGGTAVAVGSGWVGVEEGSGDGSSVFCCGVSTTSGAASVVGPVLQPVKIKMTRRQMKMHTFLSIIIDFIP